MPGLTAAVDDGRPSHALLDFIGREVDLGAPAAHAVFLGRSFAVTTGDGAIRLLNDDGGHRLLQAHKGAILAAAIAPDGASLLTGGDDGRVVLTRATAKRCETLAAKGSWIDAVAVSTDGCIAWSSRRTVTLRPPSGADFEFGLPSTCRSLDFSTDGARLAAAHYGGVTILDVADPSRAPERLCWDGSHLGVRWSPDMRFLVSAMMENELHVWSFADGRDARLGAYPGRPLSFAWSPDAMTMATAGAPSIVLWPFDGNGPFGRSARVTARADVPVTCISFDPAGRIVAAGHRDGTILFYELDRDQSLLVRRPDGNSVTAVVFDEASRRFGFVCDEGRAGLIALEGMGP